MTTALIAVTARMLAQLARADGHDVVAFDRFGDEDLRAACPSFSLARDLGGRGGMAELAAAAAASDADAVVYGAGLENRPDLVARLADGRELLGTAPEVLAEVRDPHQLGALMRGAGLAVPTTLAFDAPRPDAGRWVRKPARGGGGRGVRDWRGGALRRMDVLQERIAGTPVSAVAVADGRRAVLLGVTEQLVGERRLGASGYAWCGNVVPPRLPRSEQGDLAAQLVAAVATAAAVGVRGCFGVDAVWDGGRAWILEVNPRPTASLELLGDGMFDVHVSACRGSGLPVPAPILQRDRPAAAKAVLFAPHDAEAPAADAWGSAVRDVPAPGEPLRQGDPVCTVTGSGPDAALLVEDLIGRAGALGAALPQTSDRCR